MANFEARVKATLDGSSLNTIQESLSNIEVKLSNTSSIRSQIESQLKQEFTIKINPVISGGGTGKNATQKLSKKLEETFNFKISSGAIESQYGSIINNFNRLSSSSDKLKTNIGELTKSYNTMMNSSDMKERIKAYEKFGKLVPVINSQIKNTAKFEKEAEKSAKGFEQSAKDAANALKYSGKSEVLSNNIQTWMNKNTKAATVFRQELELIQENLKGNSDRETFDKASMDFAKITSQSKAMGLTSNPFADAVKQVLGISSTVAVLTKAVSTVKEMAQETVKVDTAMTELRRVTKLSEKEYSSLYDSMTNSAKNYGAELDTMIKSTASWVRLGFDAKTANKLAEVSTMYQHVTDLDEGTAVNNLVTAYMGYKDSLLQATGGDQVAAMTRISDVYDLLGNKFPVSAANVAEGMDRTASVMQASGATFEQAAAMITGAGSVTQDFAKSGSALKIASLRIRSMNGALEELGEETDEYTIDSSKMQQAIYKTTKEAGKAINIFEEDGKTFRNIYDIFNDIAEVLPMLDESGQSKLLELIAGKNRSNDILAMLQNWEMVKKATLEAEQAAGTADKENAVYMDSIQGRLDSLKASWQVLSADFIRSDFLKFGTTALTGIVDGIDGIVKGLGTIGTLSAAGVITGLVKGFKSLS